MITKDLSRLDCSQTAHRSLHREKFPQFGVRYRAMNDNVNTADAESNDPMPQLLRLLIEKVVVHEKDVK